MPLDHYTPAQAALALSLSQKAIYPLYTSLASLTWILTDYFVTIEDEVRYIWPQKRNIAKLSYLWTRYYSILLLCFDVIQIHVYARPGVTNAALCVYTDPITRTAGGILLWSAEIVMQLRVYALYGCSKRVAIFNAILFLTSLGLFFWILIVNTQARWGNISGAVSLINGCPAINGAPLQWVLWIPATVFEGILFGFALWKSAVTTMEEMRSGVSIRKSIMSVVTRDNILYFFGVAMLLTFNNLMVVGVTRIPWFSFAPFHACPRHHDWTHVNAFAQSFTPRQLHL
ncbi:hypothetical protein DL96DRAFT_1714040 [Flagelloscypha sp. PMI_526]|nr:hypothetical protein DL96DRAFT_1714040 [Flagelloscypha sp. PMI_526]